MPIYIRDNGPDPPVVIADLCEDNWRLPDQSAALVAWVEEHGATLPPGEYLADIGFSPRADAPGGGGAFPPAALRAMGDLGMTLWLSEYPGDEEE